MENEGFLRKNYKLKRILKSSYSFLFTKKDNPKINISKNSLNKLDDYYKESNIELGKLLKYYKYKNLPNWLKN